MEKSEEVLEGELVEDNNLPSTETMWTQFWDMHSGGPLKTDWAMIYIEAPEKEACLIFQNRFGRNPHHTTCECCGGDYSIYEGTLTNITAFHRNCAENDDGSGYVEKQGRYGTYQTLSTYLTNEDVLIIPANSIKPEERLGQLEEEFDNRDD